MRKGVRRSVSARNRNRSALSQIRPSTWTWISIRAFAKTEEESSAEGEGKSRHACIEELDLEPSINDGLRLSNQLIQPLFGDRAVALVVNVHSAGKPRRLPI